MNPTISCTMHNEVEKHVDTDADQQMVTENECIIYRHLRGIHPLLDYDASESQSMISIWLK